jgi:hypothetical protein
MVTSFIIFTLFQTFKRFVHTTKLIHFSEKVFDHSLIPASAIMKDHPAGKGSIYQTFFLEWTQKLCIFTCLKIFIIRHPGAKQGQNTNKTNLHKRLQDC